MKPLVMRIILVCFLALLWLITNIRVEAGIASSWEVCLNWLIAGPLLAGVFYYGFQFFKTRILGE